MLLNDFLNIKLGVEFEGKYNALAVKEVIDHPKSYSLINEILENQLQVAELYGKQWTFDSSYFDCDDIELCAGYAETMELYRAFLAAFAKDVQKKTFKVSYASFGLDYLEHPLTSDILDPCFHYLGMNYISIFPNKTELGKEIYYPAIAEGNHCGVLSADRHCRTFLSDNEDLLGKIAAGFRFLCETGNLFANQFDNAGLSEHRVRQETGEVAYFCDSYQIRIGKNLLRFFQPKEASTHYRHSVFRYLKV